MDVWYIVWSSDVTFLSNRAPGDWDMQLLLGLTITNLEVLQVHFKRSLRKWVNVCEILCVCYTPQAVLFISFHFVLQAQRTDSYLHSCKVQISVTRNVWWSLTEILFLYILFPLPMSVAKQQLFLKLVLLQRVNWIWLQSYFHSKTGILTSDNFTKVATKPRTSSIPKNKKSI